MKTLALILFLILGLICFNAYADLEVDGTATVTGFKMVTGTAEGKVLTSDLNGVGTWRVLPASAGILSVTGTNGIISNTVSRNVTLQADATYLQRRVNGSCTAGNSIRVVNADGTVTCEAVGGGSNNWTLGGTNLYTHDVDLGQNWKVGIGTNTPSQKLSINGNLELSNSSNPRIIYLGSDKFIQQIGSGNTFLGIGAGSNTPTNPGVVDYNTGIGFNALFNNRGVTGQSSGDRRGAYNTAEGAYALYSNTTGYHNAAVGYEALRSNVSGADNAALGYQAGYSATGDKNVFVGYQAGYSETGSNKLYIANSATPLIYGDFVAGVVGIGTTTPGSYRLYVNGDLAVNSAATDKTGGGLWGVLSDARLKDVAGEFDYGLDKVMQLKPVRFHYKKDNPAGADSSKEYVGFVAQDVLEIIPEAVRQNDKGYLVIDSDSIFWSMLNAIKKLKLENDDLKQRIDILESSKAVK